LTRCAPALRFVNVPFHGHCRRRLAVCRAHFLSSNSGLFRHLRLQNVSDRHRPWPICGVRNAGRLPARKRDRLVAHTLPICPFQSTKPSVWRSPLNCLPVFRQLSNLLGRDYYVFAVFARSSLACFVYVRRRAFKTQEPLFNTSRSPLRLLGNRVRRVKTGCRAQLEPRPNFPRARSSQHPQQTASVPYSICHS